MGKKKHARIVVNGIQLYNLGADTAEMLKEQTRHTDWHPLTSDKWPVTLWLKQFKPCDVKFVTILFITRTPGHKRRIDAVHQYWYQQEILTTVKHLNQLKLSQYNEAKGKWEPFYTTSQDPMYRLAFNLLDLRVSPGEDMLGWVRPVMKSNETKINITTPAEKWHWYTKFWKWICGK